MPGYICPMGTSCSYKTTSLAEIVGHLALMHDYDDLAKWGYRKDYMVAIYCDYLENRKKSKNDCSASRVEKLMKTAKKQIFEIRNLIKDK